MNIKAVKVGDNITFPTKYSQARGKVVSIEPWSNGRYAVRLKGESNELLVSVETPIEYDSINW